MFKIIKRFKKKPLGLVTADYEIRYRRQMQGFIRRIDDVYFSSFWIVDACPDGIMSYMYNRNVHFRGEH